MIRWGLPAVICGSAISALTNFVPWPVAAVVGAVAGALAWLGARLQERAVVDFWSIRGVLRDQLGEQLIIQGISVTSPLRVRWRLTDRPVSDDLSTVVGPPMSGRVLRLRGNGDIRGLGALARRTEHHRLVLIGVTGAGKTIAATFLGRGASTDDQAWTVFSLSSWDTVEPLYDWAAGELHRRGPEISVVTYRSWLAAGRIVPILDGLDELPTEMHAPAIRAINRATDGKPVVLTCRTEAYEQATGGDGPRLSGALVVELEPVSVAQALTYLTGSDGTGWDPVVSHLRTHPTGALATCLSVPLLLSIVASTYSRGMGDPAELCGFTDNRALRDHLLDRLIPAAYSPNRNNNLEDTAPTHYTEADTRAALTFLARHLVAAKTVDLAWWELHRLLPPARFLAVRLLHPMVWLAVMLSVSAGYALAAVGVVLPTAMYAAATLLGVGFRLRSTAFDPEKPQFYSRRQRKAAWRRATRVGTLWTGLSLVPAVALFIDASDVRSTQLAAAAVTAVCIGVAMGWRTHWRAAETAYGSPLTQMDIRDAVRGDRVAARLGSYPVMLLTTVVGGMVILHVHLTTHRTVWAEVVVLSLFCLSCRMFYSSSVFRVSNWLLRRELPYPLLPFLEHAHQRGLLRQTGAMYQFRHQSFQTRLAHTAPTPV